MESNADATHTPLHNVWRQIIPQGHDKSLKNAFYNVAAFVFVGSAGAAAWSVYLILQPFLNPLLWSVLFGSVLHPVKDRVAGTVRKWLFDVKEAKSLLSVSVALLPVTTLDNLSEIIGWYFLKHMRAVVMITTALPIMYIIIHYTPSAFTKLVYSLMGFTHSCISSILHIISYIYILIFLLVAIYIVAIIFYWTPKNEAIFKKLGLPVWLLGTAAFICMWPALRVPLFFLFCLLLLAGLIAEALDLHKKLNKSGESSLITSIVAVCIGSGDDLMAERSPSSEKEYEIKETVEDLPDLSNAEKPDSAFASSQNEFVEDKASLNGSSNVYLKGVFVACIVVQLWRHSYLIPLLPLAVAYYGLKKATSHQIYGEGVFREKMNSVLAKCQQSFYPWLHQRQRALLPLPIKGLIKLLTEIDHKIVSILASSTDAVVTLIVMLGVLIFLILASIFLAVQIQGEGMQLLVMGSQVINATIVNNPEFHEMLPEGFSDAFDSTIDNAYHYGRAWLSDMIRGMLGETDTDKTKFLEKQVIELWDHIYQAWLASHPQMPYMGPVVTSEAVALTFDSLIDGIRKTPGLISFSTISDVIGDNIGTVMSVLESIWGILLSNLNLALSAVTAAASILLGGSLSILNGLLNLIVFFSALFYILSTSNDVYMPVAILTNLAPGQMHQLGSAVEDSINGVFKASFKMGAFYGMWTWLLHTVFATNIVYIPAVLGALFGAVPLVGTYWAAIPGAVELFWGHGSPIMALFLILAQLLPLSCVDTAIYAEIKGGGHPYLTGLAVAGGIFCWGVQGAILGPLVLCILLVVIKMYATFIQPTEYYQKIKTN